MYDLFGKLFFTVVLNGLSVLSILGMPTLWLLRKFRINKIISFALSGKKIRILFLENQPPIHAGAKFRVEVVAERLRKENFHINVHYPFTVSEFERLSDSKGRNYLMAQMLFKKVVMILKSFSYDLVIVRRELLHNCEYGGLLFEKLLLTAQSNVILDMDDFMPFQKLNFPYESSLFSKINRYVPKKTTKVFGLYQYYTLALDSFGKNISAYCQKTALKRYHVFPMCIDYPDLRRNYTASSGIRRVGWISRAGHFPRLERIIQQLNKVYDQISFELVVIADKPFHSDKLRVPITNIAWNRETEIENILSLDFGIAPIFVGPDEIEVKGTFKLIQYMALGVVPLVSDLPYSRALIEHGKDGFLIADDDQWADILIYGLGLTNDELYQIGNRAFENSRLSHHIDNNISALRDFYLNICD